MRLSVFYFHDMKFEDPSPEQPGWPQQVFDFLEGYQVFKTHFRRFFQHFFQKSRSFRRFSAFLSKKEGFGRFYCKKEGFYFCFSPNSRDNFSAYD